MEVPIEDEDASILPEEDMPEVGDVAVTPKQIGVKVESVAADDALPEKKTAKTLKSTKSELKLNGESENREIKPDIGKSNNASGRSRLSSSGSGPKTDGTKDGVSVDAAPINGGAIEGVAEVNNLKGKKSAKKQKECEGVSNSCSVKVRKLSTTNLKTETPSSPKKAPSNTPPPHVTAAPALPPQPVTPPPPAPESPGEGKSANTHVKSSPTRNRISSPKCISPLKRPYPNQKTSVGYHEHFQDWIIEDYTNVTKLFSKPGTYIQGRDEMLIAFDKLVTVC